MRQPRRPGPARGTHRSHIVTRLWAGFGVLILVVLALSSVAYVSAAIAGDRLPRTVMVLIVAGAVAAILLCVLLAAFITRGITRPAAALADAADRMARGNLRMEDLRVRPGDEMGALAAAFQRTAAVLTAKAVVLERIAAGDLTANVEMASQEDNLGASLSTMVASLHDLVAHTRLSLGHITGGAGQVAEASQTLSQSATQQASALEEVSSALTQVSGQARQNAENAAAADQLARKAVGNAEGGNARMNDLVSAMLAIDEGSREITKIVKLIDDIAFQINLLALNASVEAARAGKYGKGFAVVADEVRNLAVRSAGAVRDTTHVVEKTTTSIDAGRKIAEETAGQFGQIVQSVGKVADLLSEIAQASKEQAQGVTQITTGLAQVDQGTQANMASAEESAVAARELSDQVAALAAHVARARPRAPAWPRGCPPAP